MDQLAIYNMAISLAGGRKILPSVNDNSPEREQCELWYETAKEHAFRLAHWAELRAVIAPAAAAANLKDAAWIAGKPTLPWSYAFTKPVNLLTVRYIVPADDVSNPPNYQPFDDSGAEILTNVEQPVIVYTRNDVEPELWKMPLAQAVASVLGSDICYALSAKVDVSTALLRRAATMANMSVEFQAGLDQQFTADQITDSLGARQ